MISLNYEIWYFEIKRKKIIEEDIKIEEEKTFHLLISFLFHFFSV